MLLSRGWRGLIFFWVGVAAFCCIGATTLQVLGPPDPDERAMSGAALDQVSAKAAAPHATPAGDAVSGLAANVPGEPAESASPQHAATASPGVVPLSDHDVGPNLPPEPNPVVAIELSETPAAQPLQAAMDTAPMTEPADGGRASGGSQDAVAVRPSSEPVTDAQRGSAAAEPIVRLRIARDFERCPAIACYKWQLLSHGSKLPHDAMIDLAQLRLAPGQREAAENGQVELIVDALQRREKINGRDSIILVAKNLDSVTPLRSTP